MNFGHRATGFDMPAVVLVIDNDPACLDLVHAAIKKPGIEVLTALHPQEGIRLASQRRPRLVVVDEATPGMPGIEVLHRITELDPTAGVVLLSARYSSEGAEEAMRRGASGYFVKPLDLERLEQRVAELLVRGESRPLPPPAGSESCAGGETAGFEGIIGQSQRMRDLFVRLARVAPHCRTALITGPTGSGKELVARALHRRGGQARGPFVVVNCAALPAHLADAELFGHARGAFTGAVREREGLFEAAGGGTLFLDEIGEMPLAAQAKLLRVIQERELLRVGSSNSRPVSARVVAATNRDLRAEVAAGRFREDLYFRLAMVELRVPPLADRREDLPLLLRHFLGKSARELGRPVESFSREAESRLLRHSWPGNVRELENAIAYACMICEAATIGVSDLPELGGVPVPVRELPSLEQLQREYAREVVARLGGNAMRAAGVLGVSRSTVYRLIGPRSGARSRSANPDAELAGSKSEAVREYLPAEAGR